MKRLNCYKLIWLVGGVIWRLVYELFRESIIYARFLISHRSLIYLKISRDVFLIHWLEANFSHSQSTILKFETILRLKYLYIFSYQNFPLDNFFIRVWFLFWTLYMLQVLKFNIGAPSQPAYNPLDWLDLFYVVYRIINIFLNKCFAWFWVKNCHFNYH